MHCCCENRAFHGAQKWWKPIFGFHVVLTFLLGNGENGDARAVGDGEGKKTHVIVAKMVAGEGGSSRVGPAGRTGSNATRTPQSGG